MRTFRTVHLSLRRSVCRDDRGGHGWTHVWLIPRPAMCSVSCKLFALKHLILYYRPSPRTVSSCILCSEPTHTHTHINTHTPTFCILQSEPTTHTRMHTHTHTDCLLHFMIRTCIHTNTHTHTNLILHFMIRTYTHTHTHTHCFLNWLRKKPLCILSLNILCHDHVFFKKIFFKLKEKEKKGGGGKKVAIQWRKE